ncbi:MAG TPA: hypothetical protein PKA55_17760 [Rhodoblastus sp.]|nr:hypothetical protein [Rhodoblastus sp.]
MAGLLLAAFCLAVGGAAAEPAKTKRGKEMSAAAGAPAPTARKPGCARANYPGDPVCAWEDDRSLPTPSARAVRREVSDDVVVNDKVSVGAADPVAMAKPPAAAGNPYPVRKKEPVGGGAAVNYRF